MESPAPPCSPDAVPAMEAQATLPDHLMEEILLRVPTAADLARASMAGPSLRRIITDHSFLRRFRALHPPPLLGILSDSFFLPAQAPHPSAAAAGTLAATDFSCSFLPSAGAAAALAATEFSCSFISSGECPWYCCDFRDGRALLCVQWIAPVGRRAWDVAVCDPLHRRYLLLPPVPQDMCDWVSDCDLFLAPADIAADAPFRFRVMCLLQCLTNLVLYVYSSSGPHAGQWHTVTIDGWAAVLAGDSDHERSYLPAFGKRYYAHGCFCWPVVAINKLLLLDTGTMEFSSVNIHPDPMNHQLAFVEASEGRLGMFELTRLATHRVGLRYSILDSTGDDPGQWQMKKVVTFSNGYCYQIVGVAGGYLLLCVVIDNPVSFPPNEVPDEGCFSLNLRTMDLERFSRNSDILPRVCQLYSGFPPYLSPPTTPI